MDVKPALALLALGGTAGALLHGDKHDHAPEHTRIPQSFPIVVQASTSNTTEIIVGIPTLLQNARAYFGVDAKA